MRVIYFVILFATVFCSDEFGSTEQIPTNAPGENFDEPELIIFDKFSDDLAAKFRVLITEENLQHLRLPLHEKSFYPNETSSNFTYKLLHGYYIDASTLYRNGSSVVISNDKTVKCIQVPFYFKENLFWYTVETTDENNQTTIGEIRGEAREFVYYITFLLDLSTSVIKVHHGKLGNSGKFAVRFENIDNSLREEFTVISSNIFQHVVLEILLDLIQKVFGYILYIDNLRNNIFG